MKVIKLKKQQNHGCTFPIKMNYHRDGRMTRTSAHRIYEAKRFGHDPLHCGKHATYTVDGGILMCSPCGPAHTEAHGERRQEE